MLFEEAFKFASHRQELWRYPLPSTIIVLEESNIDNRIVVTSGMPCPVEIFAK